ncbi:hypothetical protein FLM55_04150 [Francisella sp. Scap27]|uniref:hypothetical protein n=1 Tax=Francisella sp. Scap27 TaxID=2589986 RepID=UPI0015BBE90C|nr:hypothetical protein [Francisella sp. Scap27]QLE78968.1 hypothetical protein FLM55_04150 [Francisella sp. Scap27]
MKKIIYLFSVTIFFANGFGENNYNPKTGKYYLSGNNSFYRSSDERGNEVIDRDNSSIFMGDVDSEGVDIADDLVLDSYTSSTNLVAKGSSGGIKSSKFYTQETKLTKKILDDKFELYGGTVLGASPYELNNTGGVYDPGDRIAAFAGTRAGARYNVSDSFGLLFEEQYNLTGEMAENTNMFSGFDGAQYQGSKMLKAGFEWNF